MGRIHLRIGSSLFSAALFDNPSARAWVAQMPMTLWMRELNGNEKYFYLSEDLPMAAERVGDIRAGDLMLYGADCLVLFYESFHSSYSYTRLGHIEDTAALAAALGDGDVQISFVQASSP